MFFRFCNACSAETVDFFNKRPRYVQVCVPGRCAAIALTQIRSERDKIVGRDHILFMSVRPNRSSICVFFILYNLVIFIIIEHCRKRDHFRYSESCKLLDGSHRGRFFFFYTDRIIFLANGPRSVRAAIK